MGPSPEGISIFIVMILWKSEYQLGYTVMMQFLEHAHSQFNAAVELRVLIIL